MEEGEGNRCCSRVGWVKSTKHTWRSWLWSVIVLVLFIAQVIMNILAGEAFGSFGGASNSQLSKEQPTFLTPDGVTFSVWGIIYLFQALFSIYQVIPCYQNSHTGVSRARFWVALLFLGNCLWLPVFSNRLYWVAFMLMLVMDLSLVMIYRTMNINYGVVDRTQSADMVFPSVALEDEEVTRARLGDSAKLKESTLIHPWPIKLLCFVGFSTNISWLAVASMVNLLVATGSSGWHQAYTVAGNNTLTSITHTVYVNGNEAFVVMAVCLVAAIACVLAVRNSDVPYALVAIWALGGVNRAQSVKAPAGFPEEAMSKQIADWAIAMMVVVAVATVVGLAKAVVQCACRRAEEPSPNGLIGSTTSSKSGMHYTDEKAITA